MSSIRVSHQKLVKVKEFSNHVDVRYIFNKKSGLRGFIAIHNSNLGPAVGGTRMYPYKNETEALKDVLRLSRAMTYKCAIARVPFGGGKAVIIDNPNIDSKDNILAAYAVEIKKLKGKFYTGEDVGISEADVQEMLKIAPYFIGKSNQAGDPSPHAAKSTFLCMGLMIDKYFGKSVNYQGLKVAVKGVGKVGGELVRMLLRKKASVYIADVDEKRLKFFSANYDSVKIVKPDKIHKLNVDVYSPCAMGNEFNKYNIHEIGSKLICGAANNQLEDNGIGDLLFLKDIKYVPDYLANSGGVINVVDELNKGGYKRQRVNKNIHEAGLTCATLMNFSEKEHIPPNRVADFISESVFMNFGES